MQIILKKLQEGFNQRVRFINKRPNIWQLIIPVYYEDGDMIEIFLEIINKEAGLIRICDYGMTLMRLSYSYELNTANKEKIFQQKRLPNQR